MISDTIQFFHSFASNQKRAITILLGLWAICQILAYQKFGILYSVDSHTYVDAGDQILKGTYEIDQTILYSSYNIIFTLLSWLGLSYKYVVSIHLLFSVLCLLSIYYFTKEIAPDSKTAAFISGLLYLLWFKFHQWNFIIYSDSIFTSLIIISFYCLYRFRKRHSIWIAIIIVIYTVFIRPPGLGLAVAFIIYILLETIRKNKKIRTISLIMGGILSLIVVNIFLSFYIDSILEGYKVGEIIYPGVQMFIEPPKTMNIPESGQPLIKLIQYYLSYPWYNIRLFCLKVLLFLFNVKPYYALPHNIYVVIYLVILYVAAIVGFRSTRENNIMNAMLVFVLFQILSVGLTSENWDGRFLLPVLPIVIVWASLGLSKFLFYLSNDRVSLEPSRE